MLFRSDGYTALDIATAFQYKDIIKLLSPERDLLKYEDLGRMDVPNEVNAITFDDFKVGDKVVVIKIHGHKFTYLLDTLQQAWNIKETPFNPSTNEILSLNDMRNIKRYTLV